MDVKYTARAEKLNKFKTVLCFKHGTKQTYDLWVGEVKEGSGCRACYEKLPIINTQSEKSKTS